MLQPVTDPKEFNKHAHHITQSWQWGEFRQETPTVKKVLRLGSSENGKLERVYQLFFHHNANVKLIPVVPNCVAYLPRSVSPTKSDLEEIFATCRQERAVYLTLEPLTEVTYKLSHGQPILPAHTLYIDLKRPEKDIFASLHEKTRYNIRLAQKKNIVVREEDSLPALENFINLLALTESRQGFYSHYPEYYRKLWQVLRPSKMAHLLSAYIKDGPNQTPIASIMLFCFQDFLYYPYSGSDPNFREFMAPTLLHWEAIRLGQRLNCQTYDMWGSYKTSSKESDPWWGIYRFKKGFGGKEIDFPTYEVPFNKLWYRTFKTGNSLRWTMLHALRKIAV